MQKSLISILENSLFPSALVIFGKFIGIAFAISYFKLPYTVSNYTSSVLNGSLSMSAEHAEIISTYSDIIMFVLVAVGFSFHLARAIFFHDTHLSPKFITQLADLNLLNLIKDTYEIYHKAAVWLGFLWVAVSVVVLNVLLGTTMFWVGIVAVIATVALSIGLIQDAYQELVNIRTKPKQYISF
jgi:hypothetical protein